MAGGECQHLGSNVQADQEGALQGWTRSGGSIDYMSLTPPQTLETHLAHSGTQTNRG